MKVIIIGGVAGGMFSAWFPPNGLLLALSLVHLGCGLTLLYLARDAVAVVGVVVVALEVAAPRPPRSRSPRLRED